MKFENKSLVRTVKVSVIVSLLLLAFWAGFIFASPGFTAPNIYMDDIPSSASYVVKTDGTYFWAVRYDGKLLWSGTDDDNVIQGAINNSSAIGGTVFVKAGTYSASVTLKDNVTLYVEKGASGVTVSFDSGADCTLVDEQNGFRKEYVAGVLYSFMDYRTGQFWYSGYNRTDTFANPQLPYSYEIFRDGSNYKMKNGTTGQIDFSSTNASAVERFADGNLSSVGGIIFVKSATYNSDVGWYIHKKVKLIGEGPFSTILNITGNVNGITIDPANTASDWQIQNLQVNMNSYNGNAIYSTNSSCTGTQEMQSIYNIRIYAVAAGYSGINLTDFFRGEINLVNIVTSGTGIALYNDLTPLGDYGNSLFLQLSVFATANNVVGYDIESLSQTHTFNLNVFERCDFLSDSGKTGTVGMLFRGIKNTCVIAFNAEFAGIGIDLGPIGSMESNDNDFISCRLYQCITNAVYLRGGSYRNHFSFGTMDTAGTATIVRDDNSLQTKPNIFDDITFGTNLLHTASAKSFMQSHGEVQQSSTTIAGTTPTGPTIEGRQLLCNCTNGIATFVYANGRWYYSAGFT